PPAELRRRELAAFVRSRRARLSPLDAGLPAGGRRRTPGLRREEVAQIAGVGVTWYTWLEQARDIRVSEQVLDAIARALLLDAEERSHLLTLAGAPSVAAAAECQALSPAVTALLDQVAPFPAAVLNGRYDILAYNQAYQGLMGDLDALPVGDRNTLWLLFTSPAMKAMIGDWEQSAARCVAQFRSLLAEHVGEPAWKCLPKRLAQESADFAALWERHDVAALGNVTKRIMHPELGMLTFQSTTMWFRPQTELRLVVYVPDGPETSGRLDELMRIRPARLEVPAR
ncbi:MAG: helix-turn-helix transcriptional regulator, partial [Actinomycetes bacterium]